MPSFCWRQTNQQLISYASLHSIQQMDAVFVGVVCAHLVATTIALNVFSYGIFQYIRVRHHIHMFVLIFVKPFAQKNVKCMKCDDLLTQLLEDGGSADARLTTSRRTNASNSAETVVSAVMLLYHCTSSYVNVYSKITFLFLPFWMWERLPPLTVVFLD